MIERHLSKQLERAGERVPVGAPPIAEMLAGAARRRRPRTLAAMFATAAVVVGVIGGTALLFPADDIGDPRPSAASPTGVTPPSVAETSGSKTPPGTRLVGLGHAAIAVPAEWVTNMTRCGVPKADTVVIDVGAILACGTSRPRGVESVELWQGAPRFDFTSDETFEIDGLPAERQHTTCGPGGFGSGRVCDGTIYLPSLGVSFRAESSTSRAEVDRILSWIRIVPDRVGVPGFQGITLNRQGGAQAAYVKALQQLGLAAEIETEKVPGSDPGIVLDVSPTPGTMVSPGELITVTVVAEPASSPVTAPAADTCPIPDVRPSYVPWIEGNEPLPRPEIDRAIQGSDSSALSWYAPSHSLRGMYYVSLRRFTSLGGYAPETVRVRLGGELGSYEPGIYPGEGSIEWDTSEWTCNVVALEMAADSRFTRAETRAILIRIAESLH